MIRQHGTGRTAKVTIQKGTILRNLTTGKLELFNEDVEGKFGVNAKTHESMINIDNRFFYGIVDHSPKGSE